MVNFITLLKTELKQPPGRGILYMWYGKPCRAIFL